MNWEQWNWLDYALLLVMLTSVAVSIRNGFTREIIGLISSVVALLGGIWFYGVAGSVIEPYVSSRTVANFAGFLIIFFGILLAGSLVSWVLRKIWKVTGLSIVDRLLGAGFGFVRGLLICVAMVMVLVAFTPGAKGSAPQSVVQSQFAPYVMEASRVVAAIAPKELKDAFAERYDQVQKLLKEAVPKAIRDLPRSTV
jgi:membrane protein required for colicin V production